MELEVLKKSIENNTSKYPYLIFTGKGLYGTDFIFSQYLNTYKNNNNLIINNVDELSTHKAIDIFNTQSTANVLDVYTTDILNTTAIPNNDTWVFCKSVDKHLQAELAKYIIMLDKLEEWQIKDYAYSVCSSVDTKNIDKILKVYGKNIYRIDNELAKLRLFKSDMYCRLQDQLYTDVSEYGIYDLVNSIVKYDKNKLTNILINIDSIDVEPFGLITLLYNNFKKIIDVQLSNNKSAEELGIPSNQYWAIKKYSTNIYTRDELLQIFDYITMSDYLIKSGQVDAKQYINYIIVKIMTIKGEKT